MKSLDRRRFLTLCGVGVSATIAAASPFELRPAAAEAAEPAAMVGTIVARSVRVLWIAPSTGAVRAVVVADYAKLYSGIYGRIGSANDFVVGDRVLGVGFLRGETLVAHDVGSVFTPLTFTVQDIVGPPLAAITEDERIYLTGMNLPDVGHLGLDPTTLVPGVSVDGIEWRDPRNEARYLVTGSVIADAA